MNPTEDAIWSDNLIVQQMDAINQLIRQEETSE